MVVVTLPSPERAHEPGAHDQHDEAAQQGRTRGEPAADKTRLLG
jgi:hypothetical protein